MSRSGKLVLLNGTHYDWKKVGCNSFQMDLFKFPEQVKNGQCIICEIKWDKNTFLTTWTSEGNVCYELVGTRYSFNILARIASGFDIYVSYTNFSNLGQNFIKLDWVDDGQGFMQFYLSGRDDNFISTGSFAGANNWMQSNLDILGNLSLNEISFAASHDSGMSEIHWRSIFANKNNCQTQSLNIYDQLMCGVRYFDIRIVMQKGDYHTGHYALVGQIEYIGARGQNLDNVIKQINSFTACNNELIILSLSHCLNLDLGILSRPFNQAELNNLFHKLLDINHRFISSRDQLNLLNFKIKDFITNRSTVLIVLNDSNLKIDKSIFNQKGFYSKDELPVFDQYSNTNRLETMIKDQLIKMNAKSLLKSDKKIFLLSWTLTLQYAQTIGLGKSIQTMASIANSNLCRLLSFDLTDLNFKNFVKKGCLPNAISLDYVDSSVTAMCLAINLFNHAEKETRLLSSKNLLKLRPEFINFKGLIRRFLLLLGSLFFNYVFYSFLTYDRT